MANLITTVRQELAALRKNIARQEDQLRNLKQKLGLHERIAGMLERGPAGSRTTPQPGSRSSVSPTPKSVTKKVPAKRKAGKKTNWNAILEKLPRSFAVAQVKEAAGKKPTEADVHQALMRWRQAEKVTTNGRGQYEKT